MWQSGILYVKCHEISDLIHSASMYYRVPEENKWYNLDPEKVEQQEQQEEQEQQEQQDQEQQESDIESSENLDTSMDSGTSGGEHW